MYKVLLLLLLSVWGTPAAATVALGEIDVRSFLNQPLQAQISAQGSGLMEPGVEIRLASEEVYRRAGMVRSALPADLDIRLEGTGTDRLVRLSTQRPVREPYLGLLLEARWSAGRIFREYTILLDPPVAFSPERSAAPVVTTPVQAPPRPAPVLAPERPTPPPASVAAPEPRAPVFYTVQRGDTLGNIIRRQGYTGVSSEQAMLAILQANPQAFVGRNVNELRAGAELRLPDQREVAAVSDWDARQEIERQTRAWREGDTVRPAPPPAPPAPVAAPQPEVAPAPVDEPAVAVPPIPAEAPPSPATVEAVPERPDAAPVDRLEILAESADVPGSAMGSADMRIFQEALLSQQAAMASLRDELRSLRSELAERDQIIRVVNDEFAQLQERFREMQAQMRRQFADAGFREGVSVSERILSDPLVMTMGGVAILLLLLLIMTALRPARSARAQRFSEDFVVDDPALAPLGPTAAEPSSSSPPPPAPAPVPKPRTRPSAQEPPLRREAAPVRGAGAAAAAALVGAAASTSTSSRGAARRGEDAGRRPAPAIDKSAAEGRNVGLDMDDDLLADVDLYLAYGMNDQAISALEHAIRDGHDGNEYRVRLMEAYAANNDALAARDAAADLRERLAPGDDDLRERIAAVEGRFRGGSGAAGGAGRAVASREYEREEVADNDLAWDAGSDSNTLDFDTFDFPPPEKYQEEDTPEIRASDDDSNILRFDFDDTDDVPGYRSDTDDTVYSPEPGQGGVAPPAAQRAGVSDTSQDSTMFGGPSMETDTSENGMRLSLAEAFAEMDDREGALALLDEIMPTATAEQAAKAEELRRRIEGAKG